MEQADSSVDLFNSGVELTDSCVEQADSCVKQADSHVEQANFCVEQADSYLEHRLISVSNKPTFVWNRQSPVRTMMLDTNTVNMDKVRNISFSKTIVQKYGSCRLTW
jgi:hypothetical protein